MAKSSTYREAQKAARAIKKQEMQAAKQAEQAEKKKATARKQPGDVVSAVGRDNTVYEVYDNRGKYLVDRTGSQVLEKFNYDKALGKWISKAKGKKYIIRKKR